MCYVHWEIFRNPSLLSLSWLYTFSQATRTLRIGQDVLLRPQGEVTNQVPEVLEDGGGRGVAKAEEREKAEQRLESYVFQSTAALAADVNQRKKWETRKQYVFSEIKD